MTEIRGRGWTCVEGGGREGGDILEMLGVLTTVLYPNFIWGRISSYWLSSGGLGDGGRCQLTREPQQLFQGPGCHFPLPLLSR